MFLDYEETNMLKTDDAEEVPIPKEYSALKVFVVLKNIFRHLTDSELANARLVDRHWNFAATSELASRRFRLSTIKLHRYSSNQFRDRNYGWYLNFENTRRSLWTGLYGTDCPILEFCHLHFGYPGRTDNLQKILRSPWLSSVTSLTLSMYSETCEEFILDWFLPSLPNLQNLSCFIKPEVEENFTSNGSLGLNQAHGSRSKNSLEPKLERRDRQICSNLHSFSICFREACSFPLNLLESFPRLQVLKLEFGDAAALIKCAQDIIGTSAGFRDIEVLEITLTNQPYLKEQVEEAELNGEALAAAAAKLCNQFRVRQSLNVVSIIPAAHFCDFLIELITTGSKKIKFEIAAPVSEKANENRIRAFLRCLIPEILFRFPDLEDLHLQFLQYYSKIHDPIPFLSSRPISDYLDPAPKRTVKQLHFSTLAAEIELFEGNRNYFVPIPFLRDSHCQRGIMFHTKSWFHGVVELHVQASVWQDCVEIIDIAGTTLKCVKTLVLRGLSDVVKRTFSSMYFFPEVNRPRFPKKWFDGREVSRQYEGLPGIQSLEVFHVEQFGIRYHPTVASEIGEKLPRLKLIHLDDQFNNVIPAKYPYESLYKKFVTRGKGTSTWPSSVKHVKILTNKPDGERRKPFFSTGRELFQSYDNMTS